MSQSHEDGSCILSPIDQLMPRIYTKVYLVYETDSFEAAVKKLNEGLAKATSLVPFLKGYVHKSTGGDRNQLSLSWSSHDSPPTLVVKTPDGDALPNFEELRLNGAPLSVRIAMCEMLFDL